MTLRTDLARLFPVRTRSTFAFRMPGPMPSGAVPGFILVAALAIIGCTEDPLARIQREAKELQARDWSHIAGLPQPEAVVSAISHPQPAVAAIRRCQALTKLNELFEDPLFAPSALGSLPESGRRLRADYGRYIEQDLYQQFRRAPGATGGSQTLWRQACKGEATQWKGQGVKDQEWLALVGSSTRQLIEKHNQWYERTNPAYARAKQQARQDARNAESRNLLIAGSLITLLGVLMLRHGWKRMRALDKYEFEHRTEGGAVEFEMYEASIRHRRGKYVAHQLFYLGGALIGLLGIGFLIAGITY